ncbi:DMT family transporter [Archangium sp.]|uniref:DMT family transporter n=1 Tax=Archangium sp. TaxID=1872627 RepID=UPI002D319B7E|nr:DMT family transporter [Archangium sp.]HYO56485.1 DMT family transporter [Archangium sp.]
MIKKTRRTVALLLGTGTLLGAYFPLGKLASTAGVPPVAWTWNIAMGPSIVLGLYAVLTGLTVPLKARHLRYYTLSAAISFVAPNLIVFAAIPRLGAGFTGVMYTLSPVLTLAFSAILRMRRLDITGVLGIATGLAGALVIVFSRGQVDRPGDPVWIGIALLVPVLLATGNVYRTMDWPAQADPLSLAVGSNAFAACMLLAIGLASDGPGALAPLLGALPLAAIQMVVSAGMFALFFRLQQVGGPVFLSQIGYVGAAVGLVSGALFLDERYPATTWLGALVVAVGIGLVTYSQAAQDRAR